MACSLKKRVQSKSHIVSNDDDDRKVLGEALHRSTKTKQKKKKQNKLLNLNYQIPLPDSDVDINNQSKINENSIIYRTHCLCETHYDKQLLECNYDLPVDKLFDLIFGTNEFVRTYRQAQRFYDETATEWILDEATNHRQRTLKYKVPYESTFIGKGTILTREKQTIFHDVPGSHYMLETDVYNEGVKFSDTFSLILRYCLVQISVTTTHLRVTATIVYNKSVNGFIKQIIERNAYSASQEGLKDLSNRLHLIANFKMKKRRMSNGEIILTVPTIENIDRMNQHDTFPVQQILSNDNNRNSQSSDSDKIIHILVFLIIILLFIHIYISIKLKHADLLLDNLVNLLKK